MGMGALFPLHYRSREGISAFGLIISRVSEFNQSFRGLHTTFTLQVYPMDKVEIHKRSVMMKKILVVALFVVLALGLFTGVASAQTAQPQTGILHEYMEKAVAGKLGISLAAVESQFDAGKSLYQIALDNGITLADMPAFMQDVRSQALKAAVAAGVITQAQADRMLQGGGRGMGARMMQGGTGHCGGTGIPFGGSMMQRGGRWQQSNP